MDRIYVIQEDELRGGIYQRIHLLMGKNRETWQTVGAAVGLLGGLLSIVLGVLVWAVVAIVAPAGVFGSFLDVAGTVLLILPLPLLMWGAHCLDLLEKKALSLTLPAPTRPDAPRLLLRTHRTRRSVRQTLGIN